MARGIPFDVDVYAEDLGNTDYDVSWRAESTTPAALDLRSLTCVGSIGSPSPDTPACEYDSNTTTLLSITKSEYELVWTGDKGVDFHLQICAASESDPPDPLPDEACVTKSCSSHADPGRGSRRRVRGARMGGWTSRSSSATSP